MVSELKTKGKSDKPDTSTKYLVPVVQSTFRILNELSSAKTLNLNELTSRTEIPKSTVFRILSTLSHLGYVIRDARQRTYSLSHSLADLVNDSAGTDALRRISLPAMLRLRDEFGETVNLGSLDLDKVVYVEVVPSEYALRLSERPGASVLAHASALGKAILAYSPLDVVQRVIRDRELSALTPNTITDPDKLQRELLRVRDRGYALDKEETNLLATCVGAPILDVSGSAVAAMSLSGPSSRFNPRRDKRCIDQLLKAVREISLQYQQGWSNKQGIQHPNPRTPSGNHRASATK